MRTRAAAWLLAAQVAAAPGPVPPGAAAGLAAIRPASLAARARFLSSDALEGRATGSRGEEIAGAYLAAEMQAAGLVPAGDAGTFLQEVSLRAWRVDQDGASLVLAVPGRPRLALQRGQDFVALSDGEHSDVEIEAPVVFAGYAISAPEYGYDDLRGADLRGKIAVVLEGAPLSARPNFFPPLAHAAYADADAKLRQLSDRGAAGVLFVHTPAAEASSPWAGVAMRSREERMGWLEGATLASGAGGVPARCVLSPTGFERLIALAGVPGGVKAVLEKAEAGRLSPQALGLRARIRASAVIRELRAHNVAGLIKGSDPARAGEVVVLSAGLGGAASAAPSEGGGAGEGRAGEAGPAVLLELAKAFAALPSAPRRSVLLLAVTGGPEGGLGAQLFARRPTAPAGRVAADLHLERTPGRRALGGVATPGAGYSTLAQPLRAAADAQGIDLAPDPGPGAFAACGGYRFATEGIPSLCLEPGPGEVAATGGSPAGGPPAAGGEPDGEALARLTRLEFLLGLLVADDPGRPAWNPGDLPARLRPGGSR